jgi:hypothetical protein
MQRETIFMLLFIVATAVAIEPKPVGISQLALISAGVGKCAN